MSKTDLIKQNKKLSDKIAELESKPKGSTFTDNEFYGVKYDEEFALVAKTIAEGFVENAKGLTALAKILSSSNVTIEAMVKI